MKSRQQSLGKEAPLYADNEDAWRAADEIGLWAVADGAGGTGVYAGEWAQHLVQQLPFAPIHQADELNSWLDNHWELFFNTYHPIAQENYLVEHKFMKEGSCATLTSLHYTDTQLHWMVYGDSVALCFRPATNELWSSNLDISQIESAPHLLNWLMPPDADGFLSGVWQHQAGQQYALLSDALGQYVLMAYLALHGDNTALRQLAQHPTRLGNQAQAHLMHWSGDKNCFDRSVWKPLHAALASPERFLTYTQGLRNQQLLGVDDYTCILIED